MAASARRPVRGVDAPTAGDAASNARLLVRVPDAAHVLSISVRSVWRLIAAERLETVKIGAAVRVTRASIEALIAQGGTG